MRVEAERYDSLDTSEHRLTLGSLCTALGAGLIEIAVAPHGVDVQIAGFLVYDPLAPPTRETASGRVLLAVGVGPSGDATHSLLDAASTSGAAAVCCRNLDEWSRDRVSEAETRGISLLAIPDHVEWGELYELMRAVISIEDRDGLEQGPSIAAGLNDLFSLADATAALAGGPVTIEDSQSRVLAFSRVGDEADEVRAATILNRRVPEPWRREMHERGMVGHLLTSDEILHIDLNGPETRPRRAIAIRFGESVLGSIWLAGDDSELAPRADGALRRAAPIAALLMMRDRIGVSAERRMMESQVTALLKEGDSRHASLEQVGMPTNGGLVVLVLEATARSASAPAPIGPRLADLLALHLDNYPRAAVSAVLNGNQGGTAAPIERVYVLAASEGSPDQVLLERTMQECVAHGTRVLGIEVRVGIGFEVHRPDDLPAARLSAEECLTESPSSAKVATFDAIRNRSLLSMVKQLVEDWEAGPSSAIQALVAYDAEHGTDYVRTLRGVLDRFGSPAPIARELGIHTNTVRYRLKRISEITEVDFDDPEPRLALELELRALSDR